MENDICKHIMLAEMKFDRFAAEHAQRSYANMKGKADNEC